MRALTVLLVLTTPTLVNAVVYEGIVVGVEPDKVVIEVNQGEVKIFALSQAVKDNKVARRVYPFLHRQLVFGMRIEVDSLRRDGVDEAQGFRFLAPPAPPP